MKDRDTERKKLRIAMICDPIGNYKAGAIISVLRFSDLLQKIGHRVVFIGARSKENPTHDYHGGMKVYRFRSIPVPKSGGWRSAFPTVKEVKKILQDEDIDIVHVILPMSGAIVAVKAAQALGIKIVAHSHSQPENLFMDIPKFLGRRVLDRLWNKYLAWLYSKAESVIYPSEMGYRLLHHLTPEGKPHMIISNGVDVNMYKPVDVGDFYTRFNIPKHTVNIIYVGRLFPEKSVDTLIKAVPHIIAIHPEIHVIIVGIGYLRSKLEALTAALGVEDHVTFLTLNDEDKILAYSVGDIFVSPSFAELEGMTVLEAMACGKPIIVPDATMNAARFFVTDNGFLFETTNHKDLSEKVLRLITDIKLRKQMGEASLATSKKYDINRSVSKLEALYHSLMNDEQ
ncbi:MAG: glycosyltransferase [Candidatus Yonathbacteria bacterium]|nr:glycosyltransferase [Candidatus Yonathbacteria bacterium]